MDNIRLVMDKLIEGWDSILVDGCMTRYELYDSLHAQADGSMDMSADELTDDLAELMGWNPSDITIDQYRIWQGIVDQAADEFIRK